MADTIYGKVTTVIDGDTFDMRIDRVDGNDEYEYNTYEQIRIFGLDAAELGCIKGQQAHSSLVSEIGNRMVRCDVRSRDVYRRLVAIVYLLQG